MKKILSILGTINLLGTSTTSLVACNTAPQYTEEQLKELKEKNNIKTKDGILEWIAPQESPFNTDKFYYVVWRGNKNDNWRVIKLKHSNGQKVSDKYDKYELISSNDEKNLFNLFILKELVTYFWLKKDDGTHFKSVYRWNGEEQKLPNLDIDKEGNVIVKN